MFSHCSLGCSDGGNIMSFCFFKQKSYSLLFKISLFNFRNVVKRGKISVTNNAISLTPNHPLLLLAMEKLTKSYQPKCWDCIGPPLLTKSIMEFAGTRFVQNVPKSINIKLVPLFRFVDFLSERIEKLIKKT